MLEWHPVSRAGVSLPFQLDLPLIPTHDVLHLLCAGPSPLPSTCLQPSQLSTFACDIASLSPDPQVRTMPYSIQGTLCAFVYCPTKDTNRTKPGLGTYMYIHLLV